MKRIINDINVGNCKFYDSSKNESRNICQAEQDFCKNCPDCYYKQLQRMDKGYTELMVENARILAKLEKSEFENHKLKQENQELRDNYIKLDLQRIKEIEAITNLESEE